MTSIDLNWMRHNHSIFRLMEHQKDNALISTNSYKEQYGHLVINASSSPPKSNIPFGIADPEIDNRLHSPSTPTRFRMLYTKCRETILRYRSIL